MTNNLPAVTRARLPSLLDVRPGGLARRRQLGKPAARSHVGKLESALVAEQHRVVWPAERGGAVNGREVEVEEAIVVEVARRRRGVGLLVEDAAGAEVVERIKLLRPQIPQEPRLGLVATVIHMGEITDEQVELSIVVEVAPAGADGVAAVEARRGGDGVLLTQRHP